MDLSWNRYGWLAEGDESGVQSCVLQCAGNLDEKVRVGGKKESRAEKRRMTIS